MSTDTAAPAPEAEAPEVTPDVAPEQDAPEAQPEQPQSPDDMLDSMVSEAFSPDEGEDPTTASPPRDEKGRFAKREGDEAQPEETADAPEGEEAPSAESDAEDEGEAPSPAASRRVITPKVDKEVREIDLDEWYADENKREELTGLVQKGMAFDDATSRRYNAGVQDIVNAASAQGYSFQRDPLAPGGVRVVPPAATTPQETQPQKAPEQEDPVTTLGRQIEELEAELNASESPTAADFLRLNRMQRQLAQAQAEAIRAEQDKYRKSQEEERQKAQQKALAEEFQRRVTSLIRERTKDYGDLAEDLASEAGQIAYGRMHTARTIEEVEQTLKSHFDRMDRLVKRPTPPPPTNGKAETAKPAATTPPAKQTPPPAVGTTGARSGVASNNPLAKAKTLDDLGDEDWQRIAMG